jgi:hypothetical protein
LAVLIAAYFWQYDSFASIRRIPIILIFEGLAYIGLQMMTRKIQIIGRWWDWLYYFGLLSIMIPVIFADKDNIWIWNLITDAGTFLLIFPACIDLFKLLFKWEKKQV